MLAGTEAMAQGMAADTSKDVGILNVALGLEHEAINAYQLGAGSGLLKKAVLDVVVRFQADHKAHRDALIATRGWAARLLPKRNWKSAPRHWAQIP